MINFYQFFKTMKIHCFMLFMFKKENEKRMKDTERIWGRQTLAPYSYSLDAVRVSLQKPMQKNVDSVKDDRGSAALR